MVTVFKYIYLTSWIYHPLHCSGSFPNIELCKNSNYYAPLLMNVWGSIFICSGLIVFCVFCYHWIYKWVNNIGPTVNIFIIIPLFYENIVLFNTLTIRVVSMLTNLIYPLSRHIHLPLILPFSFMNIFPSVKTTVLGLRFYFC